MKPIYAQNTITAIKNKGVIEWYILERDLCFLDAIKLEESYRKRGYVIEADYTDRFGIAVINELTKPPFFG